MRITMSRLGAERAALDETQMVLAVQSRVEIADTVFATYGYGVPTPLVVLA